ncbi:MAG: TlpA family protein disulfide reductase [Prevotella sp.]
MQEMKKVLLMTLFALSFLTMAYAQSDEPVLPRYIVNGRYFSTASSAVFSLPGVTIMPVKDNEGNRAMLLILSDNEIPESLLQYEIPRTRVRNVEQFDDAAKTMLGMYKAVHSAIPDDGGLRVGERLTGTFTLHDIDGGVWTELSISGKATVVNCWYSGCSPCRREMKELSAWKAEHPSVVFLSANFEPRDKVRKVAEAEGFTWTHLYEDTFFTKWVGDKGFPLTIVIDKDGIVRNVTHGTNKEKRDALHRLIAELAAE